MCNILGSIDRSLGDARSGSMVATLKDFVCIVNSIDSNNLVSRSLCPRFDGNSTLLMQKNVALSFQSISINAFSHL